MTSSAARVRRRRAAAIGDGSQEPVAALVWTRVDVEQGFAVAGVDRAVVEAEVAASSVGYVDRIVSADTYRFVRAS